MQSWWPEQTGANTQSNGSQSVVTNYDLESPSSLLWQMDVSLLGPYFVHSSPIIHHNEIQVLQLDCQYKLDISPSRVS